jgi:hypothetical protein
VLSAVSSVPGGVSLFLLDRDGAVQTRYFDPRVRPQRWSSWFPLSDPRKARVPSVVSSVSSVPGGVSLFLVDREGAVQTSYFDPRVAPIRNHLNAVLLPTGEVFVCGGVNEDSTKPSDKTGIRAAELYQPRARRWPSLPSRDRWLTLPDAAVIRQYHSVALLMPDGRVWTAGSSKNHDISSVRPDPRELRIELFEPWYFGRSDRPKIAHSPSEVRWGDRFHIQTRQANEIRAIAFVRAGSVTHAFDADQRYVGLKFTRGKGDELHVSAPPDANIAPPGFYMLFILNRHGVPSNGRFMRIGA